jgi:hypothetical protein
VETLVLGFYKNVGEHQILNCLERRLPCSGKDPLVVSNALELVYIREIEISELAMGEVWSTFDVSSIMSQFALDYNTQERLIMKVVSVLFQCFGEFYVDTNFDELLTASVFLSRFKSERLGFPDDFYR